MGYVFEELIRRFNEENNEEVGEYFILCEIINLMINIIFEFFEGKIKDGIYLIYDFVCGSGGMLIEVEYFVNKFNENVIFYLYG